MNTTKIIRGVINATKYTVTAPIVKEDYGLFLLIEGADLPTTYEVDFSNEETSGTSVTMIGNADGVHIPNQFVKSGRDVYAFLYLTGEDYGRTVYKFRIPNKLRPDRTDATPDPEEQSVIDQAIAALNDAVEQTAADVVTTTAKAAEATSAAELASQKASEAAASAEGVIEYAIRAETAQSGAMLARDTAVASKNLAMTMASEAAGHAESAAASALTANTKAGEASASASTAAGSALDAKSYRDSASLSAENASMYAGFASESATLASESASTATAKASEAAQSATTATTKAGEASASATAAQTAQTAAEAAQTAAETAQAASETAAATLENILPTDTASGAVASFSDGTDLFPAKSVVVDIDPVQDLHGYDSPWPAGGKGNLIDVQDTTLTGTPIKIADITVTGKTYTASADISDVVGTIGGRIRLQYALNGTTVYSTNGIITSGRSIATLEIPGGATDASVYLQRHTNATSVKFSNIMLELGDTATDYFPYSNICPISGWTGVNVVVSPTQDAQDGTTYPISWQSEAGTVYGGTLDVVSGELIVDRASVDLGTLGWSNNGTDNVYTTQLDKKSGSDNCLSSSLAKSAQGTIVSDMPNGSFKTYANNANIAVKLTGITVSNAQTMLSSVQLVYELATPVTYHLTPTEVRTLLGQNNVWADTGDTEVVYKADVQRWVEKKLV